MLALINVENSRNFCMIEEYWAKMRGFALKALNNKIGHSYFLYI